MSLSITTLLGGSNVKKVIELFINYEWETPFKMFSFLIEFICIYQI